MSHTQLEHQRSSEPYLHLPGNLSNSQHPYLNRNEEPRFGDLPGNPEMEAFVDDQRAMGDTPPWSTTVGAYWVKGFPARLFVTYVGYCIVVVLVEELLIGLGVPLKGKGSGLIAALGSVVPLIALLSAFRTMASYNRWWGARDNWQELTRTCLDRARIIPMAWDSKELIEKALTWTVAYLVAAKAELRGERQLPELEGILSPEEVASITSQDKMVPFIAGYLSELNLVANYKHRLAANFLGTLDGSVSAMNAQFYAAMSCVHNMMPPIYFIHLRNILFFWLLTYPICFGTLYAWWAVPICMLVAFVTMGICGMGTALEKPFGNDPINDLPVDAYIEKATVLVMSRMGRDRHSDLANSIHPDDSISNYNGPPDSVVSGQYGQVNGMPTPVGGVVPGMPWAGA